MDGIFNVLKPPGMTSHDVVGALRKILNMKKIGHGGTLDPLAAGVLPVFTGIATRFLEYAAHEEKSYRVAVDGGEAFTLSGSALMNAGLKLTPPKGDYASLLVELEAIKE